MTTAAVAVSATGVPSPLVPENHAPGCVQVEFRSGNKTAANAIEFARCQGIPMLRHCTHDSGTGRRGGYIRLLKLQVQRALPLLAKGRTRKACRQTKKQTGQQRTPLVS